MTSNYDLILFWECYIYLMPGKFVKTKAIVLKRTNYKEADKIVTLYTLELGKITTLAKGIRKLSSKKRSHLELFNYLNIYLVEGKNWYIATQAESIHLFPKIKQNYEITQWGYYMLEIFEKMTNEMEQNENLFKLLLKSLILLEKHQKPDIINTFNLHLIKIQGFNPEESSFSPASRDYMKQILVGKYENILKMETPEAKVQKYHEILKKLTEEILERKIKTSLDLDFKN